MATLKVLRAAFASVQDAGRFGYAHLGVSRAGFSDARAGALANILLGNAPGVAALEAFSGVLSVQFLVDTKFATAGLMGELALDADMLPVGARGFARSGQTLMLRKIHAGRVLYLALPGGLVVPPVLGSAATDIAGGFGGHAGRTLRTGDVLHAARLPTTRSQPVSRAFLRPVLPDFNPIRVMFAPDCPAELATAFCAQPWQISPQSERMGTRLIGAPLSVPPHTGVSAGVVPGVIQLPPNGHPIALGVDAQTVGGYFVLGCVIRADLWRMAQSVPGERLYFAATDLAQAQAAWRQQQFEQARVELAVLALT